MAGGQLEVCICSYADSIFNNKSEIRKSTSLLTPPCVSLSTVFLCTFGYTHACCV